VIGFFPSTVEIIVGTARLGWSWGVILFLVQALGMGVMGFGGTKLRLDGGLRWGVAGFLIWLSVLVYLAATFTT